MRNIMVCLHRETECKMAGGAWQAEAHCWGPGRAGACPGPDKNSGSVNHGDRWEMASVGLSVVGNIGVVVKSLGACYVAKHVWDGVLAGKEFREGGSCFTDFESELVVGVSEFVAV